MSQQLWVKAGEKTAGPLSPEQLRQLASAGKLKRHFLVSADGQKWMEAGKISGLTFSEDHPPAHAEMEQRRPSQPAAKANPHAAASSDYQVHVAAEETGPRECPNCGATLYYQAAVCGTCHFDLAAGRPATTKGVDPSDRPRHRATGSWAIVRSGLNFIFLACLVWCGAFCLSGATVLASLLAFLLAMKPALLWFVLPFLVPCFLLAVRILTAAENPLFFWGGLGALGYFVCLTGGLSTSPAVAVVAASAMILSAVAMVLAGLGMLAGLALCWSVPGEARLRLPIIAATAGWLIGGVAIAIALPAAAAARNETAGIATFLASYAIGLVFLIAGQYLFFLYLKGIARFFDVESAIDQVNTMMMVFTVIWVTSALLGLLVGSGVVTGLLAMALNFSNLICGLIGFFVFMQTVAAARDSVY